MQHTAEELEIMNKAGVGHMAFAPTTPVQVEEEDFLAGSAPACNLGEACESCQ